VFVRENQVDSAQYYSLKAFKLAVKKNLQVVLPSALMEAANVQKNKGK
jgi:hypothetical protein